MFREWVKPDMFLLFGVAEGIQKSPVYVFVPVIFVRWQCRGYRPNGKSARGFGLKRLPCGTQFAKSLAVSEGLG